MFKSITVFDNIEGELWEKIIIQWQNRSIVKPDDGLSTQRRIIVPEDR